MTMRRIASSIGRRTAGRSECRMRTRSYGLSGGRAMMGGVGQSARWHRVRLASRALGREQPGSLPTIRGASHIALTPFTARMPMSFAPRPSAVSRPTLRHLPVLIAAALACGGTDRQGGNFVNMYDNAFNAPVVRVPVGGRVKWINVGKNVHNAVAADQSWSTSDAKGPDLAPGAEHDVTFSSPGIYRYYCTYHGTRDGKGMAGVVVVGDVAYSPGPKGGHPAVADATGSVPGVPRQVPTLPSAVGAAESGRLVLIDRGVYHEEVTVTTPSLTLRGF